MGSGRLGRLNRSSTRSAPNVGRTMARIRFVVSVALWASALGVATSVRASGPAWRPAGPDVGGTFVALAVDPTDPSIVYAAGAGPLSSAPSIYNGGRGAQLDCAVLSVCLGICRSDVRRVPPDPPVVGGLVSDWLSTLWKTYRF